MKCELCGNEFDENKVTYCKGCMYSNCKMICCPYCGYQYVGESKIVSIIRRILKW